MEEIRWKQRYSNFEKALARLTEAIRENEGTESNLIKEGIIQRFEFTHELAWKVLKDFLNFEGYREISGSRSASRKAFSIGLIDHGEIWMDMIESRNNTVHTYQDNILEHEFDKIIQIYHKELIKLQQTMNEKL